MASDDDFISSADFISRFFPDLRPDELEGGEADTNAPPPEPINQDAGDSEG